ncbi:MAG: PD-(D/E)XK nuclease family protein, partial [bacterium]
PEGPFPTLFSALDRIIKEYFQQYRERGMLPPLVAGKLPEGKLGTLPSLDLRYEHESGLTIYGRLDEVFEYPDGSIVPLDHKTRASAPEEVHPAYVLQANVYSALLTWKGVATRAEAFFVYYIPASPPGGDLFHGIPLNTFVKKVETSLLEVEELIEKIAEVLYSDSIPPPAPDCIFCDYVQKSSHFP